MAFRSTHIRRTLPWIRWHDNGFGLIRVHVGPLSGSHVQVPVPVSQPVPWVVSVSVPHLFVNAVLPLSVHLHPVRLPLLLSLPAACQRNSWQNVAVKAGLSLFAHFGQRLPGVQSSTCSMNMYNSGHHTFSTSSVNRLRLLLHIRCATVSFAGVEPELMHVTT